MVTNGPIFGGLIKHNILYHQLFIKSKKKLCTVGLQKVSKKTKQMKNDVVERCLLHSPAGAIGINHGWARSQKPQRLPFIVEHTIFHTELSGKVISSTNRLSSPPSQKDFHFG